MSESQMQLEGEMRGQLRILVTGAAGFIGSNLGPALQQRLPHASVSGLDRKGRMRGYQHWYRVDLTNAVAVREALEAARPDTIIHLAAQSYVPDSLLRPADYIRDNVAATSCLLFHVERAKRPPRIVLASSCEVYGDRAKPADESALCRPKSPYAATKLAQEHLLQASEAGFGTQHVTCRLFNNFGRGQQQNRLLPQAIRAASTGTRLRIFGDGTAMRDWLDVRDTCDALVSLVERELDGVPKVLNLGAEQPISVAGILHLVENSFGVPLKVVHERAMPGHLASALADASLARTVLGWQPQRTVDAYLAEVVADHSGSRPR